MALICMSKDALNSEFVELNLFFGKNSLTNSHSLCFIRLTWLTLSKNIYLIPSCKETKYANETTCHIFLKFTIPLVKIVLAFLNSVWQVKASFKKGTQQPKSPPINKRWLLITG